MATEVKNVRILTKSEQKQSIKGVQKPKKNIIKNYLESPFALEWPKVTSEDEEEITALLRKSCLGLQKLNCKPAWKQVGKYKGAERKVFLKEHHKKLQENLDPDSVKKNKEREEALSHLMFGYNAVMRAVEKDRVVGVLLLKNVKPDFITKAFLPGCAKKCIPLVPLNDLEKVLQDKETLALPHTCMVLGLKPSVKDESNLFYPLFTKMSEALKVEECVEDSSEDEEDCIENLATNEEEKESPKPSNQPSENPATEEEEKESPKPSNPFPEVDISSYHLKRSGSRGKRAFVPDAKELQVNKSNVCDDFMSFVPMPNPQEGHKVQDSTTELEKASKSISENLKTSPAVDENIDFSSMILVDPAGDENPLLESLEVKQKTPDAGKPKKKKGKAKQKKKRKRMDSDSYVPAKTKQLKGNPYRKGRVM